VVGGIHYPIVGVDPPGDRIRNRGARGGNRISGTEGRQIVLALCTGKVQRAGKKRNKKMTSRYKKQGVPW